MAKRQGKSFKQRKQSNKRQISKNGTHAGIVKARNRHRKRSEVKKMKVRIERMNDQTTDSDVFQLQGLVENKKERKQRKKNERVESVKMLQMERQEDIKQQKEETTKQGEMKKRIEKEAKLIDSICL